MSLNYYAKQIRVLAEIDAKEQSIVDELRAYHKNSSIELDDVISGYFKMLRKEIENYIHSIDQIKELFK